MQAVRERLGAKERPTCRWIGVNRKLLRYRSRRDDEPVRLRLVALAAEHRRYGLPRFTVLLRRDGVRDNHKRIGRIYRAAGLQVRKRVRRKLALGRGPVDALALVPNDRWSLDFVHDRLRSNRRFRILGVGDDCTRGNLALEADFAFSGERMTRVLDAIAALRGYPKIIVLDNGPEMCSLAMLRWASAGKTRASRWPRCVSQWRGRSGSRRPGEAGALYAARTARHLRRETSFGRARTDSM